MSSRDVPTEPGTYLRKADSWDHEAWASVPNRLLRDPQLSWEAKGAFGWIASHRQIYKLSAEDLAHAGPKGRHHAREMLRDLEYHGYLTRQALRNPATGAYDVHLWTLHPQPVPAEQRTWRPSKATRRAHPGAQTRRSTPQSNPPDPGEPTSAQNPRSAPESSPPDVGGPDVGPPTSGGLDIPYKEEKTNQKNKPTHPPTPSTPLAAVPDPGESAGGLVGGSPPEPNTTPARDETANAAARDLVRTLRLPGTARQPNRIELAELHRLTDRALSTGWTPAALRTQVLAGLDHATISDPVRVLLARLDPSRLLPLDPPATPEQTAQANHGLRGKAVTEPDPSAPPASEHTRQQAHAEIQAQLAARRSPPAMPRPHAQPAHQQRRQVGAS